MTPPEMADEQIQELCTGRYAWTVEFVAAIIAARDKQWAEMLGEPVAWTWDTKNSRDGFVDAHFQFSKPDSNPAILNLQPLYAPKQEKPE